MAGRDCDCDGAVTTGGSEDDGTHSQPLARQRGETQTGLLRWRSAAPLAAVALLGLVVGSAALLPSARGRPVGGAQFMAGAAGLAEVQGALSTPPPTSTTRSFVLYETAPKRRRREGSEAEERTTIAASDAEEPAATIGEHHKDHTTVAASEAEEEGGSQEPNMDFLIMDGAVVAVVLLVLMVPGTRCWLWRDSISQRSLAAEPLVRRRSPYAFGQALSTRPTHRPGAALASQAPLSATSARRSPGADNKAPSPTASLRKADHIGSPSAAAEEAIRSTCHECGAKVEGRSDFCHMCGRQKQEGHRRASPRSSASPLTSVAEEGEPDARPGAEEEEDEALESEATAPLTDHVQGQEGDYLADNTRLQADSSGVQHRGSKNLEDGVSMGTPWGERVRGVDCGDGWLHITSTGHYAPMFVQGHLVLKRSDRAAAATATTATPAVSAAVTAPVPTASLAAASATACHECGAKMDTRSDFCHLCGKPQPQGPRQGRRPAVLDGGDRQAQRRAAPDDLDMASGSGASERTEELDSEATLPLTEELRDQVADYLADNSELKAKSFGIQHRASKNMDDMTNDGMRWGSTVRGVDCHDGWLQISERCFVPMFIEGHFVLKRADSSGQDARTQPL